MFNLVMNILVQEKRTPVTNAALSRALSKNIELKDQISVLEGREFLLESQLESEVDQRKGLLEENDEIRRQLAAAQSDSENWKKSYGEEREMVEMLRSEGSKIEKKLGESCDRVKTLESELAQAASKLQNSEKSLRREIKKMAKTIFFKFSASFLLGAVILTSSQPASINQMDSATVAFVSIVLVVVID